MTDEPSEIELKFELEPEALRRLKADPRLASSLMAPRELSSTYFDTPGHDLRNAGFTLRVRQDDGRRVQTVKSDHDGGLISRGEWEQEIDAGIEVDLDAIFETPLKPLLARNGLAQELKPVFATKVVRQSGLIDCEGSQIEVSFDEGQVEGDGRRAAVSELELELKRGEPASLFTLAQELGGEAPLKLSFVTKAARGYALLQGGKPLKVKQPPPLKPKTSAGDAFQLIGRVCLLQFSANEEQLHGPQAHEAVHQMRVALRRLRSAIALFGRVAKDAGRQEVKDELKWLASQLDEARDLDVFISETFEPAARAHPEVSGMAAFGELLMDARELAHRKAAEALDSERRRQALLKAAGWIEAGEWRRGEAAASPVGELAARAISKRFRHVRRRGTRLAGLEPAARHQLRIEVKKLRYSVEFFAALYKPGKVRPLLKTLKALQDGLGGLNDIVVGRERADRIARAGPAAAAFAAGVTAGVQERREVELMKAARKAHRRLEALKPFW